MTLLGSEEFRAEVKRHLLGFENRLVDALKSLIAHQYPPEVFSLSFTVFSDSFTSQFHARAFFMDCDNCEHFVYVDGKAEYPSPIDPKILDVGGVYPEELEEQFDETNPDSDAWSLATSEFIAWFHACWCKAGGEKFPLSATIGEHDSDKEFNLKTGVWQESYADFHS